MLLKTYKRLRVSAPTKGALDRSCMLSFTSISDYTDARNALFIKLQVNLRLARIQVLFGRGRRDLR